jgi:hypothetical protein
VHETVPPLSPANTTTDLPSPQIIPSEDSLPPSASPYPVNTPAALIDKPAAAPGKDEDEAPREEELQTTITEDQSNMSPNSSRPEPHLTVPQVSTDEQPQAKDNLSPKFDEFLSFLKDDAPDNARDDDNAAASSGDDVLDKGELKTPDPEATPEAVPHVPAVVDPDVGGGPPVATSAQKKNVTPNYDLLAYSNYIHRHAETKADFSTALNSNAGTGKRCYRLNLERPFDIHCEQSPLVSLDGSC